MKNRIDAEIMAMEHGLGIDAEDPQEIEPPAVKRMKREGRRKPRGYTFPWR